MAMINNIAITSGEVSIEKLVGNITSTGYIHIQGVLISFVREDQILIFPKGSFVCSCCSEKKILDETTCTRFDITAMKMYCNGCMQILNIPEENLKNMSYQGVYDAEYMKNWPTEDLRESESEFQDEWTTIMKNIVSNPNSKFVFYNNRTIEDFRTSFLARRVIRRMRENIIKKWRCRTSQVLQIKAYVGKDMAEYWTQNKMKTQ